MPYYCLQCRRVFFDSDKCSFCNCAAIKQLKINSPVNVIGSKIKGKVVKINKDELTLIIYNESNEKYLKNYKIQEVRKII